MNDEWLAIRLDRLNSIVQVVITVLLNTSLAAESTCLALLSGSALFELFIHLGRGFFSFFLSLYYIHIYCARKYTYIKHICFSTVISFFFSWRVWHICTGATIVIGRYWQQVSLEFTILLLLEVMMVVVYVISTRRRHCHTAMRSCAIYILSLVRSLTFYLLLNESSLNIRTDRVHMCKLGKILVRNK